MNLSEKIEIAKQLEMLKVDIIEAGFAVSSPGDFESVATVAKTIKNCTVASLSRSVKKDIDASYEALKEAVSELENEKMVTNLTDRGELVMQELALKLTETRGEEDSLREKLRLACPALLQHGKYRTVLFEQSGDAPVLGSAYRELEAQACAVFGPCLMAHSGKSRLKCGPVCPETSPPVWLRASAFPL